MQNFYFEKPKRNSGTRKYDSCWPKHLLSAEAVVDSEAATQTYPG